MSLLPASAASSRPPRRLFYVLGAWLLAAVCASGPVRAQEAAEPPSAALAAELEILRDDLVTGQQRLEPLLEAIDTTTAEAWLAATPLESLEQRIAEAPADSSEQALWQAAAEHERAAAERLRAALDRAELAQAGPERLDEAAQRVDEMLAGPIAIQVDSSLSNIEALITRLNNRRAETALELEQRREALARLEEQLGTQAETLDSLRAEREQQLAAAAEAAPEDPGLAAAADAQRAALERRFDARINAAQLDGVTLPPRIETLRLEARTSELESRWLTQQFMLAQAEFNQRSTQEIRALSTQLQRLIEQEPDFSERFSAEIAALRTQLDDLAAMQDRIVELQTEREALSALQADFAETLQDVEERVAVSGLSEALGSRFLEEQRRLRRLEDFEARLTEVERELARSSLREIALDTELAELAPIAAIADDSARAELRELQRQATSMLVQSEISLREQLEQTGSRLRNVLEIKDELEQALRETLLWWPSHQPVSVAWAERLASAPLALIAPEPWAEVRSAFVAATLGTPWESAFAAFVFVVLLSAGRGIRPRMRALADRTSHLYTDKIGLTFRALGWTLLRIAPIPVLLLTLSWQLNGLAETSLSVETFADVLFNAAVWWAAGHALLMFTSPTSGVGAVHLGWSPVAVQRLRRHLRWYLPLQFLLIIGLGFTFGHPNELVFDVFSRVGLIASSALAGVLPWFLLAEYEAPQPSFWQRHRHALRTLALVYFSGLVGLALAGYLLTVSQLLAVTMYTAVVLVFGLLGYQLAMRAIGLSELRLEIRWRLEQHAARVAAGDSSESAEPEEPHISIDKVSSQTRALVRATAGTGIVLALLWVWADVLPALNWLDTITLWSRTIAVGDTEIVSVVSLQDVLLACFLTVMFIFAAGNLPGLVEIVLARTGMDAAGRYTVATLLRYVLVVVGVITAFSLIGLRWAELQWMIAALTLGLGFGLQEVVANFISGIIMLFERPVRVGDTVTIGEFSGTVTKIRTRATTIVDWDNREIVVPNKMFITERLINWTLSDTVTRIVLPVGVSYDTDIDLVMETLDQIARKHPIILQEPEPQVLFMKFGDSALSFELRAYVQQLEERLPVISDLHVAIVRAFRAKGIEIAFPQMDLHIRDLPASDSRLSDPSAFTASSPAPRN